MRAKVKRKVSAIPKALRESLKWELHSKYKPGDKVKNLCGDKWTVVLVLGRAAGRGKGKDKIIGEMNYLVELLEPKYNTAGFIFDKYEKRKYKELCDFSLH